MASVLEIPDRREARTKTVPVPVSTKTEGGDSESSEFEAELPASLADAIAIDGERDVFKMYVSAKVIRLQAKARDQLRGVTKGTRSRSKYLEELGL